MYFCSGAASSPDPGHSGEQLVDLTGSPGRAVQGSGPEHLGLESISTSAATGVGRPSAGPYPPGTTAFSHKTRRLEYVTLR